MSKSIKKTKKKSKKSNRNEYNHPEILGMNLEDLELFCYNEELFKQNKYSRWYFNIIHKARSLNRKKGMGQYFELHHIIPRAAGRDDSKENLVLLTAREHMLVHLLLVKMTTGALEEAMISAISSMSYHPTHARKITPRLFEKYRIEAAEIDSKRKSRIIWQFDLDGNFIGIFNSFKEAHVAVGLADTSGLKTAVKNYKPARGFFWRLPGDTNIIDGHIDENWLSMYNEQKDIQKKDTNEKIRKTLERGLLQFDLEGNLIRKWNSVKQVFNILHIRVDLEAVRSKTMRSHGFYWRYPGADDVIADKLKITRRRKRTTVIQIDPSTDNVIGVWETIRAAAQNIGISGTSLTVYGRFGEYKGYKWIFEENL